MIPHWLFYIAYCWAMYNALTEPPAPPAPTEVEINQADDQLHE